MTNKSQQPPQATDIEEVVLGAILIEPACLTEIADMLNPAYFYDQSHQLIYDAILKLDAEDSKVDLMTVFQKLKKENRLENAGGHVKLSELTNKVGSSANIEHHARILQEKYMRRKIIQDSHRLTEQAYQESNDIFELTEKAEKQVLEFGDIAYNESGQSLSDISQDWIKEVESISRGRIDGVKTGISSLDNVTNGFHNSDLIIIAARPGMGKSSTMVQFAKHFANTGPVGIFSLEMSCHQIFSKFIGNTTGLNSSKFRSGYVGSKDWQKINDGLSDDVFGNIFVDDEPGLTPFGFRSKARRLKKKHGIQAIIVDYLQLMEVTDKGMSREQQVSKISRNSKKVAKELNIPVIALSQLSRAVEHRGGWKIPTLSDLRESGSLEMDSDQVIFKWWPKGYGFNEDHNGQLTEGYTYFFIAKNRHGPLGEVSIRFDETTSRLWDESDIQDESEIPF